MVSSSGDAPALGVVFFGTPAFAVPTLEAIIGSPHRVVAVVTQPDRPRGRGKAVSASPVKARAQADGIAVLQPERLRDAGVAERIERLKADIGVVAAYGQLVPERILRAPRLGLVNVHASLLPKYRGAAPVHRAVVAGEAETGVTIMRLVARLDAGPMLARRARPIAEHETSAEVEAALATLGAELLVETLDALARGTAREIEQDDDEATYAPKLTRQDSPIDWARPAREVHDLVRGLHPWPHAVSRLDGRRHVILRTRTSSRPAAATAALPGTILDATDRLVVATGAEGAVEVLEIQVEGRRAMAAADFLRGTPLPVGARFASPSTPSPPGA